MLIILFLIINNCRRNKPIKILKNWKKYENKNKDYRPKHILHLRSKFCYH